MPMTGRPSGGRTATNQPLRHVPKYSPRSVARETSLLTNAQRGMRWGDWRNRTGVRGRQVSSPVLALEERLPCCWAIAYDTLTSARGPRSGPPVAPVRGDCRPCRAGIVPSWHCTASFLPPVSAQLRRQPWWWKRPARFPEPLARFERGCSPVRVRSAPECGDGFRGSPPAVPSGERRVLPKTPVPNNRGSTAPKGTRDGF